MVNLLSKSGDLGETFSSSALEQEWKIVRSLPVILSAQQDLVRRKASAVNLWDHYFQLGAENNERTLHYIYITSNTHPSIIIMSKSVSTRPFNSYNLFYILERELILQSSGVNSRQYDTASNTSSRVGFHNYIDLLDQFPRIPARYQSLWVQFASIDHRSSIS